MYQIWQKDSAKFTDQNTFLEKVTLSRDHDQLYLSKSIPNVSFKFISGQEICK